MKKISLFAILILININVYSQNFTDSWNGILDFISFELPIQVNILETADGFRATLDSPEQNGYGIPVDSLYINSGLLYFEIGMLGVTFKGELTDDKIDGIFTQGPATIPLTLSRGPYKQNRPQEPNQPYPYLSEDVCFQSAADSIMLAGTLTLPVMSPLKKKPAVVLVSGSGPQDRNEEVFKHKPFLVIADYLTRHGIAVLRYDDRGVGKSTGTFSAATMHDFRLDAHGAIKYLMTRPDIDSNLVGVMGHSEGGTIAMLLASEEERLAFSVSLAGTLIKGDSGLIQQNRKFFENSNFDQSIVDEYLSSLPRVYDIVTGDYTDIQKEEFIDGLHTATSLPDEWIQNIRVIIENVSPWLKEILAFDPAEYLSDRPIFCPVLAVNGKKDIQVESQYNLPYIEKLIGGKTELTMIEYDDLNHLFQTAGTGYPDEYPKIEETFNVDVLKDIKEWIIKVID